MKMKIKITILLMFFFSSVFFLSACSKPPLQLFNPEIRIENATGKIVDDKSDWLDLKVVSWYKYIYYYKDLWLEISTLSKTLVDEKIFLNRFTGEIFSRKWNKIYSDSDYVELLYKTDWTSLDEEIKNKHLDSWCIIQTWNIWNAFGDALSWFYAVYISSADWNLAWDENCILDKNNPENLNPVVFVSQTDNSEEYLKISIWNACAPGPCSVFWEIKFR